MTTDQTHNWTEKSLQLSSGINIAYKVKLSTKIKQIIKQNERLFKLSNQTKKTKKQ